MIFKLRTAANTKRVFEKINQSDGLPPYILSKIAIALSVKEGPLKEADFHTDNTGLELNRQTIFADQDLIFRSIITCSEGKVLEDEEYFPKTVKAHLDRGAKILEGESRYSRNLLVSLCHLDSHL